MGGVISGLSETAAWCLCSACTTATCCGRGKVDPTAAKVFYMMFLGLSTVLAVLVGAYGDQWLDDVPSFVPGCAHEDDGSCYGIQGVFRVSFGTTIFFLITFLCSFSASINLGFWGLKFVLLVASMVMAFFIKHDSLNTFAKVSQWVSAFYLVLMLISFVDFAYKLHDKLSDKIDEVDEKAGQPTNVCQNRWKLVYVVLFFLLWGAAFSGIIAMYAFMGGKDDPCSGPKWFVSITLITGLAYTVMSPMTWTTGGGRGVIPPAIVFCYCVWLCWSAISANENDVCNPMPTDKTTASVLLGVIVAGISVMYTSYSASNAIPLVFSGPDEAVARDRQADEDRQELLDEGGAAAAAAAGHGASHHSASDPYAGSGPIYESDVEAPPRSTRSRPLGADEIDLRERQRGSGRVPKDFKAAWAFHLIMAASAMYMCMVLTNWATRMEHGEVTRHSTTTMWIKVISQWVTIVLYIWTLMAQRCCPNRDFS